MPKPSQRCTFGHSPTTKPKAIASLRGKLKRYLLVRKKIWYLVHALAAIDLFLFPLSASVCPIHHGRDREAIILVFQTVIQRSSQNAEDFLHPQSDNIVLVVTVLVEEGHLSQATRGEVNARP